MGTSLSATDVNSSQFFNDSGNALLPKPSVNEVPNQQQLEQLLPIPWDRVGNLIIGMGLPAWHVLPLFLDLKIAADPALPGLTHDTLPIATTAIFVGWLAGATVLDKALEVFEKEQLVVLCLLGLLLVLLATLTLPYLTAGDPMVFVAIRFVYGLLMNLTNLNSICLQEGLPKSQGNQAAVLGNILYCLSTILMAWSCSGLTLAMDWRFEALFWYGGPLILALLNLPNAWKIVQSLPVAISKKLHNIQKASGQFANSERKKLTFAENRNIAAMAVGFLACGSGFYGLTYSAGQLSPDAYLSCMLLYGADILGYLLALSADNYGRNKVQACCFFAAALCLFLCSTGEPGTPLVLSAAMAGRLCLDVCFTLVYVALAQIFNGRASNIALSTCVISASLGAAMAPLSGTWPTTVSCPIFASLCIAAACCTMTLEEGTTEVVCDDANAETNSLGAF